MHLFNIENKFIASQNSVNRIVPRNCHKFSWQELPLVLEYWLLISLTLKSFSKALGKITGNKQYAMESSNS